MTLNNFLASRASILGLDIGSASIKLVECRKEKAGYQLVAFGRADLPTRTDGELPPDFLYLPLRQILSTTRLHSRKAVVALGGRSVVTRLVTFPFMELDELAQAVKWDADKYIPFDPGSYYYDYAVVNQSQETGSISVLLAATLKQSVDLLVNACKRLDISLCAIDLESVAILRTIAYRNNVIVVDIGAFVSNVIIFVAGVPIVSRSISVTGEAFATAPPDTHLTEQGVGAVQAWLPSNAKSAFSANSRRLSSLAEELTREIHRTIEYYQLQDNAFTAEKICLTGGGALYDQLCDYVAKQYDIPVTLHDPLQQVAIAANMDRHWLQSISPQLAVAIGLAMRGDKA